MVVMWFDTVLTGSAWLGVMSDLASVCTFGPDLVTMTMGLQMEIRVGAPSLSLRYTAALQAAYANGVPKRGEEVVLSRIRIRADVKVPGTYVVVHPYGREVSIA